MALTDEQWEQLQTRLEEERQDIAERLEQNDSFGMKRSMRDSLEELSLYDNHPADIGSELFERGKDLALRGAESNRLREIDHALERMAEGTYGTCVQCGGDIPFQRLQAEPSAEKCVSCKDESETHDRMNRPVEEFFLYPGYERTNLDGADQVPYDGEDAWQDVAGFDTEMHSTKIIPRGDNYNVFNTDQDDRVGYVEDIEGFLLADMEGNPIDPTPYTMNDAYYRAARDGWVEDYGHQAEDETEE